MQLQKWVYNYTKSEFWPKTRAIVNVSIDDNLSIKFDLFLFLGQNSDYEMLIHQLQSPELMGSIPTHANLN